MSIVFKDVNGMENFSMNRGSSVGLCLVISINT